LLDRYEQRTDFHEGLCLDDFSANYVFSKSRGRTRQGASSDNEAEEENNILGVVYFALREREWNKPSISRYRPFNVNIYFRALVMLCSLWRDEQTELVQRICEEFYQGKANFVRHNAIECLEDALRRAMEEEDNSEKNIDKRTAVNE